MSNIIVMSFSPRNIIGCFLKKRLTKGGGGGVNGHLRTPRGPPCGPRPAGQGLIFLVSGLYTRMLSCGWPSVITQDGL